MNNEKKYILSDDELSHAISLFTKSNMIRYKMIDTSRGNQDMRQVYFVDLHDSKKIVLKVTINSFTHEERIKGWRNLCIQYNELGIYCPEILKRIDGDNVSVKLTLKNNKEVIIYAEEYKKYQTFEEYENEEVKKSQKKATKSKELKKYYKSDIKISAIETIGMIAKSQKKSTLVPWVSSFCLYDKFDDLEDTDENYINAHMLYEKVSIDEKMDLVLLKKIWETYLNKKNDFEKEYRNLPKAVFQADLNPTNVLIDDKLKFIGLIDFNLSGTDTILNYSMRECMMGINTDYNITDVDFILKSDNYLKERLKAIIKHYKFTEKEIAASNAYYNIVFPLRFCIVDNIINNIKKGNYKYANSGLEMIYNELIRDDISDVFSTLNKECKN